MPTTKAIISTVFTIQSSWSNVLPRTLYGSELPKLLGSW